MMTFVEHFIPQVLESCVEYFILTLYLKVCIMCPQNGELKLQLIISIDD